MSFLHRENNPRHARLFELLRQQSQADMTIARVEQLGTHQISEDDAAALQGTAAQSLQARTKAHSQ